MHELVCRRLILCTEILNPHRVEEDEDRDDQRSSEKSPQDWPERVREELECVVDPAELSANSSVFLLGGLLPIAAAFSTFRNTRELDQLLVIIGDCSPHDDLQPVVPLRNNTEY